MTSRPVFDKVIETSDLPGRVKIFMQENSPALYELAGLLKEHGEACKALVSPPNSSVPPNIRDWPLHKQDAFTKMSQLDRQIQFEDVVEALDLFRKTYNGIAMGKSIEEEGLQLMQQKRPSMVEVDHVTSGQRIKTNGVVRSLDDLLEKTNSLLINTMTPDAAFEARVQKAQALVSKIRGGIKTCKIDKHVELATLAEAGKRGAVKA